MQCKARLYNLSNPHLRGEMLRQDRKSEFEKMTAIKKAKNIGGKQKTKS